jgi:dihydropteroate synthase
MHKILNTHSLRLNAQLLSLEKPVVMGILNLTPDSFFGGSRFEEPAQLMARLRQMESEGVDIIDLGGQSTRPGATRISALEEWDRLKPAFELIAAHFSHIPVSIDTFYSEVASKAVQAGAAMINDVSAGQIDGAMFSTVAELHVPYVLMHMKGDPQTMQKQADYSDVVGEVVSFFSEKINDLISLGIADIMLDPGFGFGKTQAHNYTLLKHLEELSIFNLPILVGVSRKKMIQNLVESDAAGALNGTTVVNTLALQSGAHILRVHDVKEAREAITIFNEWNKY